MTMGERCRRAFSSEPVDLLLLIQVTGPDLDIRDGHCCSRNRRCRAMQLVVEKLPPSVREPLQAEPKRA
uniref:Uncharacterized protein n=1 Tax=Romanomermis culicivorax TaxID=13658 RepID=A0A915I666_ROMCU